MNLKQLLVTIFMITSSFELEIKQSKISIISPVEDHEKCYELLVKIGIDLAAIVKDVTTKNIPELIEKVIILGKDTYEDYKCFTQNGFFQFARTLLQSFNGSKKDCYIEHLNHAKEHLKLLLKDIATFHFKDVSQEFNTVVSILQDAVQNC
jgi:hypothetical protein